MLRMQADAADQVAEALGRTLIRLSVEVEDLNAALGGSPARGAELWPALSAEEEAERPGGGQGGLARPVGRPGRGLAWRARRCSGRRGRARAAGEPRRRLPRHGSGQASGTDRSRRSAVPSRAQQGQGAGPGHRSRPHGRSHEAKAPAVRRRLGVEGNGARVPTFSTRRHRPNDRPESHPRPCGRPKPQLQGQRDSPLQCRFRPGHGENGTPKW